VGILAVNQAVILADQITTAAEAKARGAQVAKAADKMISSAARAVMLSAAPVVARAGRARLAWVA
jgi:hypothetical protein